MRYADLHFHLLPGVDDGPTDMGESIELARAAVADGTRTIVATPHVRPDYVTDPLELEDRVHELRWALADARVPVEVQCGGELGHDIVGVLSGRQLEAVAQGPRGARWVLVETPFEAITELFHEATDELRARGFGVVIAHPERTADAATDGAAALCREIAAGAQAQVNAMSLVGRHGAEAHDAGHAFVRHGLVSLVASDAHGAARPPSLGAAIRSLEAAGVGHRTAWNMVRERPGLLLAGGLSARPALTAVAA